MSPSTTSSSTDSEPELRLLTPLALTRHPAAVYLATLSEGSRQTMRGSMNAIAALLTGGDCDAMTLNWAALRYHHTAAVRAVLMEKYAPATANKMLCGLRRVLEEAKKLELMSATDYKAAVDLRSIPGSQGLRGRALTKEEIAALMQVCYRDSSVTGARDAALLAILRGGGLRRREVVNLDLGDFDAETGEIAIRNGKGSKDRIVYLSKGARDVVHQWLRARGSAPGALLSAISRGKRILMRRLTSQAVLFILQKRGEEARVGGFSAHDFRRTYISDLLDAGVDIVTVQRLAGHNDPATTSRYDRRGKATLRKASEMLDFPGNE